MIERTLKQAQELDLIMQKAESKEGLVLNNVRKGSENYRIYKLCQQIEKETGFLKQVQGKTDFSYLAIHTMEATNNKPFEKMYYDNIKEKEEEKRRDNAKTNREWITIILSAIAIIASTLFGVRSEYVNNQMRGEIDSIAAKSTHDYLKMQNEITNRNSDSSNR